MEQPAFDAFTGRRLFTPATTLIDADGASRAGRRGHDRCPSMTPCRNRLRTAAGTSLPQHLASYLQPGYCRLPSTTSNFSPILSAKACVAFIGRSITVNSSISRSGFWWMKSHPWTSRPSTFAVNTRPV